ncbi:hypothetical protein [Rummeliibacillus stabekisii]|uniref:hypothetical protein n=1 Tax=Rummeliibacillus stabekisii TaxID=241244 RepID=UPI0011BD757D|nr:hypothetical protein [Rummeliibacillus stabekisii]MBB5170978.1 hypothetical protein [Rummeliibacillus stabekisii]
MENFEGFVGYVMLISATGGRFPRASVKPPRYPAGVFVVSTSIHFQMINANSRLSITKIAWLITKNGHAIFSFYLIAVIVLPLS